MRRERQMRQVAPAGHSLIRAELGRRKAKHPFSDREFETKNRAFEAIRTMRSDGVSLHHAAKDAGTTPATVHRYLPAALRRLKNGHWLATKSDRYVRHVNLPGLHGPVRVRVHGSEEARFASSYLASIARWEKTGDVAELAPFHGKKVGGFELVTSARSLRTLDDAGLLQLDTLYAALKDTA